MFSSDTAVTQIDLPHPPVDKRCQLGSAKRSTLCQAATESVFEVRWERMQLWSWRKMAGTTEAAR